MISEHTITQSHNVSGLFTAMQIADELSSRRPISLCQPSLRLHRGAFSLRGLIAHLRTLLPKDFNQLPRKLAVGTTCQSHHVNTSLNIVPWLPCQLHVLFIAAPSLSNIVSLFFSVLFLIGVFD